jgi:DNA-binding beta-propeller fold protein YncE
MVSKTRAAGPIVALLAVASAFGTEACSDDIEVNRPDAGLAGDAGTAVDASVAVDAGTPDSGTIVWADAAPRDAGNDATAITDAAVDAGELRYGRALWLGTDFVNSELVVASVPKSATDAPILGRVTFPHGDMALAASGGRLFALVRDKGLVKVLSPSQPWVTERELALTPDAGSYADNPYDVAFVPSANKAYVARYADNGVAVFDPATGTRSTSVDMTPLMASGDTDGLVDVAQLLADGVSGKVFALLQRIDQFDFSGKCNAAKPLVAAIEPTTGTLTGVAGALDGGAGAAVELEGANPQQMVLSASGRKLYVVSVGCTVADGGSDYVRRGIEEVDLATGSRRWVIQQNGTARLGAMLLWDGTSGFARQDATWTSWSASTSSFGTTSFTGIAPMLVSPASLVRLAFAPADGGGAWSVQFAAPAASLNVTLTGSPWSAVSPDATYGVSGLFVPEAGAAAATRAPSFTPEAFRRRAPSAR